MRCFLVGKERNYLHYKSDNTLNFEKGKQHATIIKYWEWQKKEKISVGHLAFISCFVSDKGIGIGIGAIYVFVHIDEIGQSFHISLK